MTDSAKKRIAVVEDDPQIRQALRKLLEPYDQIELVEATNAGEAMGLLFPDPLDIRPDALILDLMMTYGSAAEELDARSDPEYIEAGVRVLKRLRKAEDETRGRLWVAVITARSNPQLLETLRQLLAGYGRIYIKPFSNFVLENDLAAVLGVTSRVHPDLLPIDYDPPALYC